jgi:diaminohydroxyphosphoribosylaminopyrimidine deaminase/5-amino-6-(5-phosphoribosylamino)uracil reductase
VLSFPTDADNKLSVPALLDELGRRRMTNLLVEGGAAVLGSFLDARALDEVHVFIAPRLIGGAGARSPVGGAGVEKVAEALKLTHWNVEHLAGDVYLHGISALSLS